MKFTLIKERKSPPDRRVVFSPETFLQAKNLFPSATFTVESSDIRIFADQDYEKHGLLIEKAIDKPEVLLGVKEVPVEALIPNTSYFFFSHTIKKQPYNRKLLKAVLDKNITLYDHEVITNAKAYRLIGFGRYAGIVGAYNGFRAWGNRFKSWELPKAKTLDNQKELITALKQLQLPAIKILLTGNGKVAKGAMEMLDAMVIQKVSVEDYLCKSFSHVVYCQADVMDYNKRKDGSSGNMQDFFNNPGVYETNFTRFTSVTDLFISGHFYGDGAPAFFTKEQAASSSFNIKVIADISCDIRCPIPTTLRASTIAEPVYGYHKINGTETHFNHPDAITVMAVDNLPCELPKDASIGFGDMFLKAVLPAFFNGDADGILERARMTSNGKLTSRFAYLQDYVDGLE